MRSPWCIRQQMEGGQALGTFGNTVDMPAAWRMTVACTGSIHWTASLVEISVFGSKSSYSPTVQCKEECGLQSAWLPCWFPYLEVSHADCETCTDLWTNNSATSAFLLMTKIFHNYNDLLDYMASQLKVLDAWNSFIIIIIKLFAECHTHRFW